MLEVSSFLCGYKFVSNGISDHTAYPHICCIFELIVDGEAKRKLKREKRGKKMNALVKKREKKCRFNMFNGTGLISILCI